MSASLFVQIIGYVGSALIVVSLTRKSIMKLRLFGLAGTITFLAYSLLIGAYPIAVVNVVIIFVHLFFLRELRNKSSEYFTILEVFKESRYLAHFIEFHKDEIHTYQPNFEYEPDDSQIQVFILRNLVPAGLFVGKVHADGSIEVKIDFVIPQYRDFKVGEFLYSLRSGVFTNPRCDLAWSEPGSERHAEYLRRMGFTPRPATDGHAVYGLDLTGLH